MSFCVAPKLEGLHPFHVTLSVGYDNLTITPGYNTDGSHLIRVTWEVNNAFD